MTDKVDTELLAEFARTASADAFAVLVGRYVNLVYSAAFRFTGNSHHAEDISQAVFIILARKAGGLQRCASLSGWLYQTTRLTSANFLRAEIRRRRHEQEAFMRSTSLTTPSDQWEQIAPWLDEAMGTLRASDRDAVVMRFFENKSAREVAAKLNLKEATAQKRLGRALERLRKFFIKRGISSTTAIIAGLISANSVQAAPATLAPSISAITIAKGAAASGSTVTIVNGALKIMAWTKAKTAILVAVGMVLAAGTATVVIKTMINSSLATNASWADDPKNWEPRAKVLGNNPPVLILRPTRFASEGGKVSMSGPTAEKSMIKNASIPALLAIAYKFDERRMILPLSIPEERFDCMLTLPDKPNEKLQEEIKRRFGLTAHRELRETDVLVLKMAHENAPGLRLSTNEKQSNGGGSSSRSSSRSGVQELTLKNQQLDGSPGFAKMLETRLGKPVISETGSTERYDISVRWTPQAGESVNESFKQALLDQLGLELIPRRESTELLVVTRTK